MNQLNLMQDEISVLRHSFEIADKDKNGTLSFEEIQSVLRETLTSDEIEDIT
jgi:Ca2+-binding EF-hand superfamily protein